MAMTMVTANAVAMVAAMTMARPTAIAAGGAQDG